MAPSIEPAQFDGTDAQLAEMVAVADLPSLLAALAHNMDSPELLAGFQLDPTKHHEPQGGWSPDQQAHARPGRHRRPDRTGRMPAGLPVDHRPPIRSDRS